MIAFLLLHFFCSVEITRAQYVTMPKLPKFPMKPEERTLPDIQTIQMRIDHFSTTNLANFTMRYVTNAEFYNNSGIMFILVGGESPLNDALGYLYSGLMYEMAEAQGAYMYLTEHRYYGKSIPNGNLRTENLQYLTVNQSLADLADFIQAMKVATPSLKKTVLFGGSYSGSLATWARLKYPDFVDAAVAASGVYNIQVSYPLYNVVVQNGLNQYPGCVNVLHTGIQATQNLINKGPLGRLRVKLNYGWNIFDNFRQPFKVQNFFNSITVTIGNIVQYDGQDSTNNIAALCGNLTKQASISDSYTSLYKYIRYMNLLSTFSSLTTISSINSGISWLYQICTELGNMVITEGSNQPYLNTVPLSYWQTVCSQSYGVTLNPSSSIESMNKNYGGLDPNITKVVFTVGTVDPWSSTEFTSDLNAQAPVLNIQGSSHCAVLLPASWVNSSALTSARNTIKNLIPQWLQ